MKALKKQYGFWIYLIISIVITSITIIFVKSSYGVNDDFFISAISNGVYGTEYSHCLIYSSSLLGWIIRLINTIYNNLNWYVLIQYGTLLLSSALLATVFSKKTKSIYWGIILLLTFYIFIYFEIIIKISFKTTSGIASIVGLLCLIEFAKDDEKLLSIIAVFVSFLGFMYRKESFLLVCPFAAFYFICLTRDKGLISKYFKKVTKYIVILLICIFCSIVTDVETYKTEDWQEYKLANKYRSTLQDYPNDLQELSKANKLSGVNLSENDIDIFMLCKNDNAEKFGSKNLGRLVEMTTTRVDNNPLSLITKLKDFYLSTFKMSYVAFYIIIIELILLLDSKKIITVVVLNAIASTIVVVLCFKGRFPSQVAFVIYSSLILISSIILSESLIKYTNKKLLTCLLTNAVLLLSIVSYKNVKKYYESIDYFDYANNSKNQIFVVDVMLLGDNYFQRYSPWRSIDANLLDSSSVIGGWICPSPLSISINKKYGFNNAFEILGKDNNASLFIYNFEENLKSMEEYLQNNYDNSKHLECVNNPEDIWSICRFTK